MFNMDLSRLLKLLNSCPVCSITLALNLFLFLVFDSWSLMAKRLKGPDNEDRLSLLPDDILVHNILSLLPMKEAASTSILARRWRFLCLWVRSLDFDASAEVVPVHPELWDTVFPDGGGEAASRYVQWVDGIINAYRGSTALRHFRVLFCLDYAFSDKIESWLSFCLAKGVEVLELDCFYSPSQHHQCRFPSLFPGQYYPTLKSLKSLILRGLDIPSDSLNHVLAGSPFLESLEVTGSFTLTDVTVAAPAGSRLRSIHMCDCYRMRSLIVSASTPDLVSFIYPGGVEEVHLEHAPRVVELVISEQAAAGSRTHFDLISHPLFRYFSQLEALRLQASNWHEAAHWLPRLPDPRRLKRLHLRVFGLGLFDNLGNRNRNTSEKLRGLASLINAAPWLERLTLEVGRIDSGLEIRDEFSGLDLQHLRVIEMVGFRGSRSVLAVRLIKAAAASVEKLILNLGYGGSTCYPRRPYRKEKIDRYTSLVRELIEKEAPSAKVALVFTGFKKFDTVDTS